MADPFRLRVLKALTAELKTIQPDNGYINDLSDYTDDAARLSSRVFRGRDIFGSSDPLPMISILEHPRALAQLLGPDDATKRSGDWELLIQGFVPDDMDNPTDPAHVMAAEVTQALARAKKQKYNLLGLGNDGPCVTKITIGAPVVRPADGDTSSVAFFLLNLTLSLAEDLEHPFPAP